MTLKITPIEILVEDAPVGRQQKTRLDPTRQALRNGGVSFARGILNFAVTVALTPFLVSHLGASGFGTWSLLGLFVSYVTLIDFGISGAAAKFIGELSADGDITEISRIMSSSISLFVFLSAAVMIFSVLFERRLEDSLSILGLAGGEATIFLWSAVLLYVVGLFANGLQYVLLGLHRLDVANYICVIVLLSQAVGTIAVLRARWGLLGLIGLTVVTSAISVGIYFFSARRVALGLRFNWKDVTWRTVIRLLRFGGYLQVYALVSVYYFYMGKAVVGLRFPLYVVAAYEVALRLPILFRQGILTVLGPIMPAVSHLDARGGDVAIRALFARAVRYLMLLGIPIFVSVSFFAAPIVKLWVGSQFDASILPLRILSIAFGLSVFPDLVWYFLVGLGQHRTAVAFSLAEVVLGTLLCYLLSIRLGLVGVACGVLATAIVGAIFYAVLLVRQRILIFSDLSIPVGVRASFMAVIAFFLALSLEQRLHPTYWSFGIAFTLGWLFYGLWLAKGRVLTEDEKIFLHRFAPFFY